MRIVIRFGMAEMAGMYPFSVDCQELDCKKCYLRFRCLTSRDECLEIDSDIWFKHINKKIRWKLCESKWIKT